MANNGIGTLFIIVHLFYNIKPLFRPALPIDEVYRIFVVL